jgi:hypothetical protein
MGARQSGSWNLSSFQTPGYYSASFNMHLLTELDGSPLHAVHGLRKGCPSLVDRDVQEAHRLATRLLFAILPAHTADAQPADPICGVVLKTAASSLLLYCIGPMIGLTFSAIATRAATADAAFHRL